MIIATPLLMFGAGVALEVMIGISEKHGGESIHDNW